MKIRCAIVDDAPFIRELLKSLIESLGHVCVAEAGDGREAVEVVARSLPDVIFLDLVMPRKNGLDALKNLRDTWPEGKIVACTTLEDGDVAAGTRELFDGWLGKPFNRGDVESVLKKIFAESKEETA